MAKLIKKSKCKFEQGIIVKKNQQIGIPHTVWMQLNKLELIAQQYSYMRAQPAYQPGPSLDGFERESLMETDRPYVDVPDTPVTDKRVAEAMKFMEEADEVSNAKEINGAIDEYGALVDWLGCDKFLEGECFKKIDTPFLGDPLHLTPEAVRDLIALIVNNPIYLAKE